MKNIELIVKYECELLEYLLKEVDNKSKNNIKTLLKRGRILVNNKRITKHDYMLRMTDIIVINQAVINSMMNDIEILFEDDYLIAINKPEGLLSIATEKEKDKTAYHIVSSYLKIRGKDKAFVIHRLDRDTSGIIMFAKNDKIKNLLQNSWDQLVKVRGYLAVVEGSTDSEGVIKSYLKENKANMVYSSYKEHDGKLAITNYKKLNGNKEYSLLEVFIDTGRKNQIRVHMYDIKHPIVGDKKYGASKDPLKRLGLHAHKLEFVHPVTHKYIMINAKIPRKFDTIVR
jgi:23S rRNA pseudouridine1911/1915/1917 synthase